MGAAIASVTDIGRMPDPKSRFVHVIKHLYTPRERWDLAILGLPVKLHERASENGCDWRNLRREAPSWFDACEDCRAHVLDDHDRYYQPAYENALVDAFRSERHRPWGESVHCFVGDNGVFVVVKENHAWGPHVASAYKVTPRGIRPERATARDFFRAAERKLRDKTSPGGKS